MKTLNSTKILRLDLPDDHEVYLEINVACAGECKTRVRNIPGMKNFFYKERKLIGIYGNLKVNHIEINHLFTFRGIPLENVDNALKQTRITYKIVSIVGPWQPFKDYTAADLDTEFSTPKTKTIKI